MSSSAPARTSTARPRLPARAAPARVDIVVPVHNEQAALARSIRRLHDHLAESLPFAWRIVIADNASTDQTPRIAAALAADLPGVELLTIARKGRGRALREAWLASDAEVVCYMDVDLSTDLRALLPLLAPLVSGHSDVAIGTRLHPGSQVVRGARRELISRSYNGLLRVTLGARFSDAQCGFKAMRTEVARKLLPAGRDDLRGIARLLASARLTRFLGIGVVSTLAYALLFIGLRGPLGAAGANAAALALTAVANTQANRHFTFGLRGRTALLRQHAMGAVVYVLTLGLTSGALLVLHALDARPSRPLELVVLIAASVCATVTRFVALRSWVFARRTRRALLPAVRSIAGVGG